MAEQDISGPPGTKPPFARGFLRVAKYLLVRAVLLSLTLVVALYLAVIVVNLGGFIDNMVRAHIDDAIGAYAMGGGFKEVPPEQRALVLEQTRAAMEEAAGLNEPFLWRCVVWEYKAMTFEMADPELATRFGHTALLFSSASLILFFTATALSLFLSRRYGSWLDRIAVALSPISAAPSWVHGIILVSIFAVELHVLPLGGMYDALPPDGTAGYVLVVGKHMILPVLAIVLSAFFQCVYAWRTFFLIHSAEDYVEMARAKGLPPRVVERRYILRPALPYFITSFALLLIGFWQEAIALEYFFSWPGIGQLYMRAMQPWTYSPPAILGIIVIFAYILVLSIFVMDLIYALVDPRVRVGGSELRAQVAKRRGLRSWLAGIAEQARETTPHREAAAPATTAAPRLPPAPPRPAGRAGSSRPRSALRELLAYPSAVLGSLIILSMIGISIYAVTTIPYAQVVRLWNAAAVDWRMNPRLVPPAWVNLFNGNSLPNTIILDSREGTANKESKVNAGAKEVIILYTFDYPWRGFPQEINVFLTGNYVKIPLVTLTWISPDGRETELSRLTIRSGQVYIASQDKALVRRLGGQEPSEALFADPSSPELVALRGTYQLRVRGQLFEESADLDARFVLHGQVFGLGGTDDQRRDLTVALLWGMPTALGLGLLGAVVSSLIAITVAAIAAWYGGWVDNLIQRLTEINMVLPMLPVAIMVYFLYSTSIWVILAVLIILSSFGRALKNYRAAFLQVREQPYIEAARAYNAGNWRIIMRYMVPRVIPVLIPQLVIMIPWFVFLEATLSLLGVSDLYLPTWGKIIHDALVSGLLQDHYYWLLEPVALLLLTGLGFAMLGYSLDRIFNPRLRSQQQGG